MIARTCRWLCLCLLMLSCADVLSAQATAAPSTAEATTSLSPVQVKMIRIPGLVYRGKDYQNTNWSKICQTPDGRIWFSGGDHRGSDKISDLNYEMPWGFGNTVVASYAKGESQARREFELDAASGIISNAQTPGHGKIHSNIVCDARGRIYTAGYRGSSYEQENADYGFSRSYAGGMVVRYNPSSQTTEALGIPAPGGACVALYFDEPHGMLNGLSVDRGLFWRMNVNTREVFRYEPVGRANLREMIVDRNGDCYFTNDFGGLTRFRQATETFEDLPIKIPGLRAWTVSSKNVVYAVSTEGMVWSYDVAAGSIKEYGHVVGRPDKKVYTPNIALDEARSKIYFIAGSHDITLGGKPILVTLDLATGAFKLLGRMDDVLGCYGSLVTKEHTVYFSCYARDRSEKNETRPFLVEYEPAQR